MTSVSLFLVAGPCNKGGVELMKSVPTGITLMREQRRGKRCVMVSWLGSGATVIGVQVFVRCMKTHALSRGCHHPDGVFTFSRKSGSDEDFVLGIPRPQDPGMVFEIRTPQGVMGDVALLERVFSLPVRTVKSIPPSCRLAFAQALTGAIRKVVASPGTVENWVKLLLLPRCTLKVVKPTARQERRSGNRNSLQCDSILRALAMWKEGSGFEVLVNSVLADSGEGVVRGGEAHREIAEEVSPNIKQCLRKVSDGHFNAAVKVLCVKSFPKGTSCGCDGLRAQHLLDALSGEGSATASGLLTAITEVVNLWLGGLCPRVLADFVASAPLTPLLKPDNGIRPIAVGAIWRRLVSKVAMKKVGKEAVTYLEDYQFGVGVPNGAEAVLHSANRFLNSFHSDGSLAMLTVDFSNAFNLVDRSVLLREVHRQCPSIFPWVQFLYAQPARLYVGNDRIGAFTGVQQGDPLGPLLFALALHPLVLQEQENCKLPFHAWYLDDGTVIGDAVQVAKALDIIGSEGPALGLRLNIRKTEVFWPTCNGVKVRPGLFPNEIGRPERGVKLLGGAVSCDASFISGLTAKRATRAVNIMGHLPLLPDPQSELLLLRSCMGVAKLLFGLRTCQPPFVDDAVSCFDKGLREEIEDIVVCEGPFFGELQWRIATLPMRLGGLGLLSARDVAAYAFVASRSQSWELQDHILRNSGVATTDPDYASALDRLHESLPDLISAVSLTRTPPPKNHRKLWRMPFVVESHKVWEKISFCPLARKPSLNAYRGLTPRIS
ncbi:hypothetical protein L1987_10303 [Smallanthus sonchifolius]|uniref:Uncharacterized protein n=1 Tax=Smallanthus sonchifolius TaxID=185202 RepID=A0ACB9JRW8_9ASTR|nr:hypothetical protein L1987_10303 [Smallanthus sonchifolius]